MNFTDIFSAVKQGAIVITVNQRLARSLLLKVEQAYLAEGRVSWHSPTIISYDTWLIQSWLNRLNYAVDTSLCSQRLLTPEQSMLLWEQVVNAADESVLLNVSATAKAAARASRLAYQWDIDVSQNRADMSEDVAAFIRWNSRYLERLDEHNWVDRAQLPRLVLELVKLQQVDTAPQWVFAGFDVFTALQDALIVVLTSQDSQLSYFDAYSDSQSESQNRTQPIQKFSASDTLEEAMCMAQWAREHLTDQPNCSIGIIVPELDMQRGEIERAFQAVFYPSASYPTDVPFGKPYNVSLGQPLSAYAPIKQVFRWLRLFNRELSLVELSALLRSPFMSGGEAEWNARGQLEVDLRKRGFLSFTAKGLLKRLLPKDEQDLQSQDIKNDPICPLLIAALSELISLKEARPNRVKPSEWALVFRNVLNAVGWQGEREVSSVEYQAMHVWDDVLQVFSRLDSVLQLIPIDKALATLNKLANERVFQPETADAPIQIMGLMEAAGHTFDALWVCGLHDRSWPAATNPNPFLPIDEQRKQGLVQASAERQFQLAKQMTSNWSHAATNVVFSYPAFDGDMPRMESPLISDYPLVDKAALLKDVPTDPLVRFLNKAELIEVSDEMGPAIATGVASRGGVALIKDQAACPFKAFAHHRLRARGLEEPEPGIDARLRGSLLHACLEQVWQQIKTQQQLLQLSTVEQQHIVAKAVENTLQRESSFKPILKGRFGVLEAQRLNTIILDWLVLDKSREPFTVTKTEFKQPITIGELTLNTSIDRVDELDDGSTAIIDYKSGSVNSSSWFGERPEDPQLPLYGVFGEQNVQSIAFAQVKKGDCKYTGISNTDACFSALKPPDKERLSLADWPSQVDSWQRVLSTIANEFVVGRATVEPTKKACNFCDLTSLCRINEQQLSGESDE